MLSNKSLCMKAAMALILIAGGGYYAYQALQHVREPGVAAYAPEKAAERGDVVDVHGEVRNPERLSSFIKAMNNGKPDKVRITRYTSEGDPIFVDLDYNGHQIQYTYDNSQDKFGQPTIRLMACTGIETKVNDKNDTDVSLTGCTGGAEAIERILTLPR